MLARVRMARGLTQEELADAIGISLPTYRRLERKDMDNPGVRYLANAAIALGVELDSPDRGRMAGVDGLRRATPHAATRR